MSYFVIGVGGTGAKLTQTLIHLSAAGLLPDSRRGLEALLIDPDDANGNVDECMKVARSYAHCAALQTGSPDLTDLFKRQVNVKGPWTPIHTRTIDTLGEIFQYKQRQEHHPNESDLLELLFSEEERCMPIHQGFRGRPAIGSAVLSSAIDFADDRDVWHRLVHEAQGAGHFETGVPILLTGSVFGGSGAAGVPTILQLLQRPLQDAVNNLRLGLTLFLPYFIFEKIPGEAVQADPFAFALATSEALKYYDECNFAAKCASIYTLGEQVPAHMVKSAVGAADQRNEPHFLELVAGFGVIRFFSGGKLAGEGNQVSIAGRAEEGTLKWSDLPAAEGLQQIQIGKLQRMIQFAVAYHLNFYPYMSRELNGSGTTKNPLLRHCVIDEKLKKEDVQRDLMYVDEYVKSFLNWLLRISLPRRQGFTPGLVDVSVFAQQDSSGEWVLRSEFRKTKDFRNLFVNAAGRRPPDLDTIWKHANSLRLDDKDASGTGRLIRAIYDSCEL